MAGKYFSIVCTLHCMPHASACRARALCTPHAPNATHTLCTPHECSARFKLTKPISNVTIIERRSRPAATRNAPSKLVRLKLFEPIQPIQNFYCGSLELLNNSLKIFWFFFSAFTAVKVSHQCPCIYYLLFSLRWTLGHNLSKRKFELFDITKSP